MSKETYLCRNGNNSYDASLFKNTESGELIRRIYGSSKGEEHVNFAFAECYIGYCINKSIEYKRMGKEQEAMAFQQIADDVTKALCDIGKSPSGIEEKVSVNPK